MSLKTFKDRIHPASYYVIVAGAPTANDDSGDGYVVGTRWLNSTDGVEYVARSVGAGTAVWNRVAYTTQTNTWTARQTLSGGIDVFENANGAANPTLVRFGRNGTQYISFDGGSAANFIYSVSPPSNPKPLYIRVEDGTGAYQQWLFNNSGQLLAPVGTAALPSIVSSASATTGISWSGGVTVISGAGITALQIQQAQTNLFAFATHSAFVGRRANTGESAPSQVMNGDRVAEFRGAGYHDGGAYDTDVGGMRITARENYTSTATGTSLEFVTTTIGSTGAGVRWRINPSGQLCFGDNDAIAGWAGVSATPSLQLAFNGAIAAGLARYSNDANPAAIQGAKSRGTSVGTLAATSSGDELFRINGQGVDTGPTAFREAARIRFVQDAAGGATSVPGRISLDTATTGGTVTEALRIDSNQNTLHASGTAALPSVSFISDPDTGALNPAANTYVIAAGGVTRTIVSTSSFRHNGWAAQSIISLARTNGTEAAPTGIASGDILGEVQYGGYFDTPSTGYDLNSSGVRATASEAWTSTATGSYLSFLTTVNGGSNYGVRWRINHGGQLCWGDFDALTTFSSGTVTPPLQLCAVGAAGHNIGLARFNNGTTSPAIISAMSRGAGVGIYTATTTGDELLRISAQGVDTTATNFRESSRIQMWQDAAGGASAVPGRISLYTATTGGTVTEALRVDSAQQVQHLATTASTSTTTGGSTFAGGVGIAGAVYAGGTVVSTSQTAGIGYATGAGGTVTQITSRTTGVTLNRVTGAITLVSAAGSAAWQSFTVTNSAVAATDTIIVNQVSGTDLNMIHVTNIAAGSFRITFATTGGTTVEQPVFRFTVIKSVSA